jgi:predicted Rossmann fold nucleotide-binding protein DprA/Smf involved in DNA uptake
MTLHKTPITVKRLAKHYILSESSVLRVLKELSAEGKISTINDKPMKYVIR